MPKIDFDASWFVTQTFMDADTKGDGRIDLDEWKEYVLVEEHDSSVFNVCPTICFIILIFLGTAIT